MCMWSLNQDDEFYEEEVHEDDLPTSGTIWHQLARHLEVTDEQKKRIKSLRCARGAGGGRGVGGRGAR